MGPTHLVVPWASNHLTPVESSNWLLSWNLYRETIIMNIIVVNNIYCETNVVNTIVVKTEKKNLCIWAYTVVVVPRASWIVALVWVREVQLCCELKACDLVASRLHVTLVWVVVVWLWYVGEVEELWLWRSQIVVTLVRAGRAWL
jgi:hypothetical protein